MNSQAVKELAQGHVVRVRKSRDRRHFRIEHAPLELLDVAHRELGIERGPGLGNLRRMADLAEALAKPFTEFGVDENHARPSYVTAARENTSGMPPSWLRGAGDVVLRGLWRAQGEGLCLPQA